MSLLCALQLKSISQGVPAVSPANATPIEAAMRTMILEGTTTLYYPTLPKQSKVGLPHLHPTPFNQLEAVSLTPLPSFVVHVPCL